LISLPNGDVKRSASFVERFFDPDSWEDHGVVARGPTRNHKIILITSPAPLSRRITDTALKE
jgi:hypothetical protein